MNASALMAIGVRYMGASFWFKPIGFQDAVEEW